MKLLKISLLRDKKNKRNHYSLFVLKTFKNYSIKRQVIANLFRRSLIKDTL